MASFEVSLGKKYTTTMFRSVRTTQLRSVRNFSSTARVSNAVFGTPKSGPYSNLPFKVHGRKLIPFQVYWWGVLGFFFAFPFLTSWWHMKKAGNLD